MDGMFTREDAQTIGMLDDKMDGMFTREDAQTIGMLDDMGKSGEWRKAEIIKRLPMFEFATLDAEMAYQDLRKKYDENLKGCS